MMEIRARVYQRSGQWHYDFFDGRDYFTSRPHGTWREAFDAACGDLRAIIDCGPLRGAA